MSSSPATAPTKGCSTALLLPLRPLPYPTYNPYIWVFDEFSTSLYIKHSIYLFIAYIVVILPQYTCGKLFFCVIFCVFIVSNFGFLRFYCVGLRFYCVNSMKKKRLGILEETFREKTEKYLKVYFKNK